ncbi:P-type conjugative transfer protein TrbL [Achromobacter xylosoxidans]|uniref:P-type conjugative transfer protein TrbL n=1 Tax=Alcaligenes xylosoxydans xylosoxydans TaxID=85698 RepID=UPI002930467A|nr:P-type conjugative transfer protein TrbL [Achromobacter xylosoxidans]WOB76271.1 P-type conjugative transfer protein TrbL [Achromobacter xylosoxidans]
MNNIRIGPTWVALIPLLAILLLFSVDAHAAVDNHDILDGIVKEMHTVTQRMAGKLVDFATSLFWSLAAINMVWTFGMMVMRKADIGEFFAELCKFIITLGFFWWLLSNAVSGMNIAGTIIESMRDMAAQSSGLGSSLTPSGIVDVGFDVLHKVWQADLSLASKIVCYAVALIILVIFAAVAINMVLTLAESWFLLYCGIFILGFGGARWTSEIAIGYYRQVLGVGLKLFGMAVVIGVGKAYIDGFINKLSANPDITEIAVVLVAAYVFYKLSDRIPSMLASLVPGGGGFANGGMAVSAGAVAGAAAGIAGAAAGMAGAAISGGASLAAAAAGGAQAVMAAASAASQDGGGGGMSSAGGSGGESGDGGGGVAGDEPFAAASGGGGSPMAQAAGDNDTGRRSSGGGNSGSGGSSSGGKTAGQIAKGTVANLAKGIGSMASAKASSMADAAKSRIAETAGGKLAATIKAASSSASSQAASFDGNNLSATNDNAPADAGNDEVAAFVNRS